MLYDYEKLSAKAHTHSTFPLHTSTLYTPTSGVLTTPHSTTLNIEELSSVEEETGDQHSETVVETWNSISALLGAIQSIVKHQYNSNHGDQAPPLTTKLHP